MKIEERKRNEMIFFRKERRRNDFLKIFRGTKKELSRKKRFVPFPFLFFGHYFCNWSMKFALKFLQTHLTSVTKNSLRLKHDFALFYLTCEKLKRNEMGTKQERVLAFEKKERSRNAFLKISKGTRKERVPQKYGNSNSLNSTEWNKYPVSFQFFKNVSFIISDW